MTTNILVATSKAFAIDQKGRCKQRPKTSDTPNRKHDRGARPEQKDEKTGKR